MSLARPPRGSPAAPGHVLLRWLAAAAAVLASACSSTPPPPDWQMNAKSSLERATEAWLSGNSRVEAAEFARARSELARTGRPELVARAELTRCATRVASLEFDDCPAFAPLAVDASAEERAYARYLGGIAQAGDLVLLPAQHRAVAGGKASAGSIAAIADPLSALVAAGVAMRRGEADAAIAAAAVERASQQAWRRPLLAWLMVQLDAARKAGKADEASRLSRRIDLLTAVPAAGDSPR